MSMNEDDLICISDAEGISLDIRDSSQASGTEDEDMIVVHKPRKRKIRYDQEDLFSDLESDDEPIRVSTTKSRQNIPTATRTILNQELSFLRSHYEDFEGQDNDAAPNVTCRLENFQIYKKATNQLESLHRVAVHDNKSKPQYCFSGTLVHEDGSSQQVSEVDIWHVSIDNLAGIDDNMEPSTATAARTIYLETVNSSQFNCFYLLESPNAAYEKIYSNFQWLADLLKHITDYLTWASMNDKAVTLNDFRLDFVQTIKQWHEGHDDFDAWYKRCAGTTDFRHHICCPTNTKFIFYTIESIWDDKDDLLEHVLWDDLGLRADTGEPEVAARTLVTPHIARSFLESFPQWGSSQMDILDVVQPRSNVLDQSKQKSRQSKLGEKSFYDQDKQFEVYNGRRISKAALLLEQASRWKTINSTTKALIGHAIVARQHTRRCLRPCACDTFKLALVISASNHDVGVRWLDLPISTICIGRSPEKRQHEHDQPFYPIGNEVFLSDQCSCASVLKSDIFAAWSITINEDHAQEGDELFVHRKWVRDGGMLCTFDSDEIGKCPRHEEYTPRSSGTSKNDRGAASVVGLFSGLGLLDLGLFEGSDAQLATKLVVELDKDALLSYKANHRTDQPCEYLNADVNQPFKLFCLGRKEYPTFNMLVAGNPCPGFSRRNVNKASVKSQRDCTLLAHTLSWVDVFRPEMVLIENVPGMDETKPSALGQAVCCLVSMGYQVKVTTIKASTYGAATDRTRLILMATAPGIPLPRLPSLSHGTDQSQYRLVSTSAVTTDLRPIDNDTLVNPKTPYHVSVQRMKPQIERIVSKIPKSPRKKNDTMFNISGALLKTPAELDFYSRLSEEQKKTSSGTCRRIHPNQPFRTIVTHVSVMDARGPATLHWVEDRVVSLQEMRRFQGVPDQFVQIGTADKQMRQIGNSVEYNLAKLLGKCYATAWKKRWTDRTRTRTQSEMSDGMVIYELGDDDEPDPLMESTLTSKCKRALVSVDVPSVKNLSRQFRQSISLEPVMETASNISDLLALNTSYRTGIRRALLNEENEENSIDLTESERITSRESSGTSATSQEQLSDSDDDLPEIRTLLTPSRSQSQSVGPGKEGRQPYTPPSRGLSTFGGSGRRRRREFSGDTSDEESPTKKLKVKTIIRSSSQWTPLAERYGFGIPESPSSYLSSQEGETSQSPIVLD